MRSPVIKMLGKVAQAIEKQACKGATPGERKSRRRLIVLAARDGKRCHWCQDPVSFPWEPGMNVNMPKVASFDHKKTKCTGGSNHTKNGILACRECNLVRGNASYDKFARLIAEEGIETLVAAWKDKAARKAKGIKTRCERRAREALAAQQEADRAHSVAGVTGLSGSSPSGGKSSINWVLSSDHGYGILSL